MGDLTLIIFGATGDLARRKLLPAIYRLIKEKLLTRIAIIGVAYESVQAADVLNVARSFIDPQDVDAWRVLEKNFTYVPLDFERPEDFNRLAAYVRDLESTYHFSGNRIMYLATAARFFCPITQALWVSGLAEK